MIVVFPSVYRKTSWQTASTGEIFELLKERLERTGHIEYDKKSCDVHTVLTDENQLGRKSRIEFIENQQRFRDIEIVRCQKCGKTKFHHCTTCNFIMS